jgi:hypothetical protein
MNLNRASSGVGPVYLRGFPANWAWISDGNLRCLPQALLEQALPKIASHAATRPWRSLAHKIRNVLKTLKRSAELAQLDLSPLCDKLRAACDSRWSLTYFPESWAEQILSETPHSQPTYGLACSQSSCACNAEVPGAQLARLCFLLPDPPAPMPCRETAVPNSFCPFSRIFMRFPRCVCNLQQKWRLGRIFLAVISKL